MCSTGWHSSKTHQNRLDSSFRKSYQTQSYPPTPKYYESSDFSSPHRCKFIVISVSSRENIFAEHNTECVLIEHEYRRFRCTRLVEDAWSTRTAAAVVLCPTVVALTRILIVTGWRAHAQLYIQQWPHRQQRPSAHSTVHARSLIKIFTTLFSCTRPLFTLLRSLDSTTNTLQFHRQTYWNLLMGMPTSRHPFTSRRNHHHHPWPLYTVHERITYIYTRYGPGHGARGRSVLRAIYISSSVCGRLRGRFHSRNQPSSAWARAHTNEYI